ncbi:sensor histidine kinase [Micromonospora sp. CPCC 206061]|uniref:sensor histidine kinase n=1 Tax=Micromonospora sp. CPCC 206061 TaxID=3122410 RepID=UPI002FEEB6DC
MRTKLATVLVVPSLAFMVVAGVQTFSLIGQATVLDEFADEVAVGQQITTLVHDLQTERDRTAGDLAGLVADKMTSAQVEADLQQYQEVSDRSASEFRSAADPLANGPAAWRTSYNRATDALDDLGTLRGSVSSGAVSAQTVFDTYTRSIDALLTLLAQPTPGVERPELNEIVVRYVELARIKEISSQLRAKLFAAASAGRYGATDQVELTDLRAQQLAAVADFQVAATDDQLQRYERTARDDKFAAAVAMEQTTTPSSTGVAVLDPFRWWSISEDRHDLLREVERGVLGDAVDEANSRSGAQLRTTILVAGAVLIVLVSALLISVAIGRSIARSLRVLRRHALHVAQQELPDALERLRAVNVGVPNIEVSQSAVSSMDEVGEVSDAFVAVHRSAVNLAIEQAAMRRNVNAMFVNLARRSQVLVERQLELLDELEKSEVDPDQLANLFKLDHLAARMRRNDESLLVLAGTETRRRWNEPVALSTVVLAAAAEIEEYTRVRQDALDQVWVVGHAVADLVHLLAELLENATHFSPPFVPVHITAQSAPGRSAVIEITDEGLGMTEKSMREANALLAEPPAADVAASERMGHFVVSHLAARHGIRVQLSAAPNRGLVATVRLAPALLAPAPPPRELPEPAARPMLTAVASVPNSVSRELRLNVGPATVGAGAVSMAGVGAGGSAAGLSVARRTQPTRAEDVLKSAGATASATGSTWWSGEPPTGAEPELGSTPPPATPVTGGVLASGLPARVPMAQLPDQAGAPAPSAPQGLPEPDPEAVGSMLARFYGGVRRAEAEETDTAARLVAGHVNQEAR